MAMKYSTVIIPLEHLDSQQTPIGRAYRSMWSCYTSDRLTEELERIAGRGQRGLFWTDDEVISHLGQTHSGWGWSPTGDINILRIFDNQANQRTHMKIFFKDPTHALLFKLNWKT